MADNIVTLEGKNVLAISIDPAEQADKNGKPYFRARYAGKVFIVDPTFFEDFTAGNIAQVTIAENTFQQEDPENPNQMLTRQGWAYSGHATYDQISNIEAKQGNLAIGRKRFDIETRKMDIEITKLEKQAMAEVKLDDAAVNKIADAL